MDHEELLSSPEAAMEKAFLGDVMHEVHHFLHQVSELTSNAEHYRKVAAKHALVYILAQTENLPKGALSQINEHLQPHMHLLHIV